MEGDHEHDLEQQELLTQQELHNQNLALLTNFWRQQEIDIAECRSFKRHALPLARIKKIMKTDEEVNMISAEVPVLFSKACELFILELTLRSWMHTAENKRRTLQKSDVSQAVGKCDTYDFLIDIVPRDETAGRPRGVPLIQPNHEELRGLIAHPELQQYYYQVAQHHPVRDGGVTGGVPHTMPHMDPTHQLMYYQQQQHAIRLMQQQSMMAQGGYIPSHSSPPHTPALEGALPGVSDGYMTSTPHASVSAAHHMSSATITSHASPAAEGISLSALSHSHAPQPDGSGGDPLSSHAGGSSLPPISTFNRSSALSHSSVDQYDREYSAEEAEHLATQRAITNLLSVDRVSHADRDSDGSIHDDYRERTHTEDRRLSPGREHPYSARRYE